MIGAGIRRDRTSRPGWAEPGKVEELHGQLLELAGSQNKAPSGGVSIPATLMRVTVSV